MNDDLIVEILEVGPFFVNCYIVGDAETHEGLIIDPGFESQRIIEFIEKLSLRINKIIITHGHMDHIGALEEVRRHFKAPVWISEKDAVMLTSPDANLSSYAGVESIAAGAADGILREGDTVSVGKFQFKVLETPGHTPGSISLYGHGVVFTGDTLFLGSVGRTDFPGSSQDDLLESITSKLLALPDETMVYAGHGPDSTIGQEREFNPFLT